MAWLQGAYFRMALASTPVVMGMKKGEMPKYPKMPYEEEQMEKLEEQRKQDEKWLQQEREKAFYSFASLLKNCNKKERK